MATDSQIAAVSSLTGTIHLQSHTLIIFCLKRYLHRATTYLAIFNIRLAACGKVQKDGNVFPAEWAIHRFFMQREIHVSVSGL
jgi:hypothetical protein